MWPQVIQFDTRQMELEAQLGLYGEREAAAQKRLAAGRRSGRGQKDVWFRRRGRRRLAGLALSTSSRPADFSTD